MVKNAIFGNFTGSEFWFLVNLRNFQAPSLPKFKVKSLNLPKMAFLYCLNSPILDFTQNLSGSKIITFQQSQALTSHFESFCSIVESKIPKVGNTVHQILTPKLYQNLKHPTGWSEPLKIGDSK